MADWFDQIELSRARLVLMREMLREVEHGSREPIGPIVSGLLADWCDVVADVLSRS